MSKLSDNEIIKALECFAKDSGDFDERGCIGCAFEKSLCCENISDGMAKAVLDLINRLQAENERLNIEFKAMRSAANGFKAENEKLLNHYLFDTRKDGEGTPKQRAIKEFKDELFCGRLGVVVLTGKSDEYTLGFNEALTLAEKESDNLLKELVGEHNE